MPKKIFNSDLETSGGVKAASITDGTATLSGGVLTASTITDGTATLSGGVLTASTLTDGTATLSGGVLTANHVVAPLIEASPDTDLNLRSDDSVIVTIDYDEDAIEGEDNPAYYVKLRTAPDTDITLMDINQYFTNLKGNLDGELFLVDGYSSLRSSGNVELGIDTGNNNTTEKFIVYRGANASFDSGAVELLKVSAAETSISANTISLSASNDIEILAGTLSSFRSVDVQGILGIQAIGPFGEDAPVITLTDVRDISIGTESYRANSIKNYVADGDIRFRVDTGIGSNARSSELHITSSHIYIGEDDLQNSDQANYEVYIDTRSGDITTNGEIYAFQKITAHRDLEVKQKLLVQNTTSIQHAVEDVDLVAFEDFEVKLPQLEVKPSSVNSADMYDVMIHYGSSTSAGTKKLYRSPTTGFTGSHNYLSDSAISFNIGDVVGLEEGRLVYVGSNSTTAIGIIAYECKDPHVLTSLGETEVPEGYKVYCTASVGDSRYKGCQGFNVCNENGDIQPGDLLVTSSTPGYLMKQDDDIIRSKTVGKAMEAVTFDANGQATGVYGFIYCG